MNLLAKCAARERLRGLFGRLLGIGVLVLFVPASHGAGAANGNVTARRVGHYEDRAANIFVAIEKASSNVGISTGFELDEALPTEPVSIDVSDATVADVITAIMKHAPNYQWIESSGVIDIMPRDKRNSVLDIKVARFRVSHATPDQIGSAVAALPEVKDWLANNGVSERSIKTIIGHYGKGDAPRVSLNRRDATLREIMNSLVTKRGGPRRWSVSRWGDSNQYLAIAIE